MAAYEVGEELGETPPPRGEDQQPKSADKSHPGEYLNVVWAKICESS